jgi:tetratricopeptide (TPR) repeat protein
VNAPNLLTGWIFGKVVPFLDFFLFETVLAKRGIVAFFLSCVASFVVWLCKDSLEQRGIPLNVRGLPLELWVFATLLCLLLISFAVHKWRAYARGPRDALFDVVFVGFYDPSGPEGNFVRTGVSNASEAEFLRTMRQALSEHRINSGMQIVHPIERVDLLPLRVVDYRPPRGFHAVRNIESFENLVRRFSSRCLGIMWGTVDKDGRLDRFEVTLHPVRYHGHRLVEEQFGRKTRQVVGQREMPPRVVVRYIARMLASVWGASFGQMLNDLGRNLESVSVTADSRQLTEEALEELREYGGTDVTDLIRSQQKILLPELLRQEAWSLLLDGQIERALERLFEALKIDLFYPLANVREFADFYNHHYAYETHTHTDAFNKWIVEQRAEDAPEWIKDLEETAPRLESRALADLPAPNLVLFVGWFEISVVAEANIEGRVLKWFSELSQAYPENPFVLLYWGDALKVLAGPRDKWTEKTSLEKIDAAIEKYEAAYKLDPSLSVLAVRLSTLYALTAFQFENTNEGKRRFQKGQYWSEKAKPFYEEYMASDFQLARVFEEPDSMQDWAETFFSEGTASRADVLRRMHGTSE